MIKYRTVIVDVDMRSMSSMSSKRYQVDLPELRIQIQSKLEEYDEMGYDFVEMEPITSSLYNSTFTQAVVLIFKIREIVTSIH